MDDGGGSVRDRAYLPLDEQVRGVAVGRVPGRNVEDPSKFFRLKGERVAHGPVIVLEPEQATGEPEDQTVRWEIAEEMGTYVILDNPQTAYWVDTNFRGTRQLRLETWKYRNLGDLLRDLALHGSPQVVVDRRTWRGRELKKSLQQAGYFRFLSNETRPEAILDAIRRMLGSWLGVLSGASLHQ